MKKDADLYKYLYKSIGYKALSVNAKPRSLLINYGFLAKLSIFYLLLSLGKLVKGHLDLLYNWGPIIVALLSKNTKCWVPRTIASV